MSVRILIGDVRERLRDLADESVHCVVTSPPYFGLRDYGSATWEGGDAGCDHLGEPMRTRAYVNANCGTGADVKNAQGRQPFKAICGKCGARRVDKQIGLEPTPDAFVAEMVAVFREVRRVLRKDGALWLNLGDSYAGSWGNQGRKETRGEQRPINGAMMQPVHDGRYADKGSGTGTIRSPGLKPKDLIGIPWRVAFALQADGWYLRQDIIWEKPNPMPESVRDRCTKAHEYVFLLSKSERYFYDAAAVAEPGAEPHRQRNDQIGGANGHIVRHSPGGMMGATATRNRRSVWTITTQPYAEAHFATFPPELPELCIKAGTSERGCCPKCGAPWVREIERASSIPQRSGAWKATGETHRNDIDRKGGFYDGMTVTLGWSPSCSCPEHKPQPSMVLDPFGGAGTTGMVADRLGRDAILIELNPEYAALAERRVRGDAPLFVDLVRESPAATPEPLFT